MKSTLLKLIFSLLFILWMGNLTYAQKTVIAIDGSGSMRGYFNAGELQKLINEIEILLKSSLPESAVIDKIYFINDGLSNINPWPGVMGRKTVLDIALKNLLNKAYDIVYFITDNVQDTKEDSITTVAFYNEIAKEEIKEVYIIPSIIGFKGDIIYSNIRKKHNGNRGLLSYLILTNNIYRQQFHSLLKKNRKEDILLVKPITNKHINIIGTEKNDLENVKKSILNLVNQCPGSYNQIYLPNTKIINNGLIIPFDANNPPSFQLNKNNLINFFFSLASKLDHINIGINDDPCDRSINIEVRNLVMFPKKTKNHIFFKKVQSLALISPPSLIGKLKKDEVYRYFYYCEVRFGPFEYDLSLFNFWDYLRFSTIKMSMSMEITLTIPPNYFTLTDDFRNRFFTNNIYNYEKIYSPVDIVQFINAQPVVIKLQVYSY